MRTKGQALTPFWGSEALQKCALGSRLTTIWISNQQNDPPRTLTVQLFIFNTHSPVSVLLLPQTPGPTATKVGEGLFLHMSITEGSQDRSSSFHSYTKAPWSKGVLQGKVLSQKLVSTIKCGACRFKKYSIPMRIRMLP